MAADGHWVGAWTNGLVTVDKSAFNNQTIRLITRVTLGGKTLRLRLSNAYGNQKLAIGSVHVGLRDGATERIVPAPIGRSPSAAKMARPLRSARSS